MIKSKEDEEEEDRIGDLPDSIIHHILSFLPSTTQAIQTGLLSKQWRNQWTQVPVLIFDSTGLPFKDFINFIENTLTLHDCSKIKKFHLKYNYYHNPDGPQFTEKIRFATRKYVEDLYLISSLEAYMLPKFLFNNDSLVKLRTERCNFPPDFGEVNWRNLKSLSVSDCIHPWSDQGLERILSGSPLLESLELNRCYGFKRFIIASKSLKRLVLHRLLMDEVLFFEISCPKLAELSLIRMPMHEEVFVRAIENVVSGSSLLKSFELIKLINSYKVERLVIASRSLKRLVLEDIMSAFSIEISCPKLENLKISHFFNVKIAKLINFSSLLCATIDFYRNSDSGLENHKIVVKEILQKLHHTKELRIGRWFMEILSVMKVRGSFSPVLNIKSLIVNAPNLNKHYSGIACLLHNSPELENLVIDLTTYDQKLNDSWKKFRNSNTTIFRCLESHLKTVMMINFPKKYDEHENFLKLVQFLLKNAKVLEKMVFAVRNHANFPLKVHRKLLSFRRRSQHAVVEFVML